MPQAPHRMSGLLVISRTIAAVILCLPVLVWASDAAQSPAVEDNSLPPVQNALRISAEALFENDSDDINAMNEIVLNGLFTRLAGYRGITGMTVVGHASSNGSTAYNQALSERRALAVARLLATRYPATDIHTLGRGETQPIADNSTPDGAARNRRVVVYLHDADSISTYPEL